MVFFFSLGEEASKNNVDFLLHAALYVGEVTWFFKITKDQALLDFDFLFFKKASLRLTNSFTKFIKRQQ